MAHFPFVPGVVTDAQEVIPGLDAPAFVFARVWRAPENIGVNQPLQSSSRLRKVNILFSELCTEAIFGQECF